MPPAAGLSVAGGAAAVALALSLRTPWRAAAGWFAVAVVGQAAALQLVDAGPALRYQHFPPLRTLVATHPWLLALLAAQAAVVASGLARRRQTIRAALRAAGPGRVALAAGLAVATAATVSPEAWRYATEVAFAASLQLLAIATIVLLAASLPPDAVDAADRRLALVLGRPDAGIDTAARPRGDRFRWAAAVFAFAAAAALAWFSYERHPHVPDEVVYLFHARYFAEGWLTLPPPPVPAAFDVDLFHYEPTRWFSPVPPGWPALLALGVLAGAPWLVNPVLAGLCVLLAYDLLCHLYPIRTARIATALLAASPWFLFLGMSFMTHMATLLFALAAAACVVRARRTGAARWGLLAGAAVGASSLVRPLDGLIVGALIALWSLGAGGRRLAFRPLAGLAAGTAAVGALVLPYNHALTGDPLRFPINLYTDTVYGTNSNAYGFGPDRGLGWPIDPNPGHGPLDGLINANLNAFGLNTDLFGWSTGSLIFVAWLLVSGRPDPRDRLMLAASAAVVAAYFFYYFSGGPDFAARYWFPIVVPLVALTAAGIRRLEPAAGARVVVAAGALTAMALVTFVPWRAADKYRHFRGMRADIRALADAHAFDGDLVLIRGGRMPDYASAAIYNPVDLRSGDTVYAWDRDADVRAAIVRAYPGRRVWVVEGPTASGNGYRVVQGPITGEALLADGGRP